MATPTTPLIYYRSPSCKFILRWVTINLAEEAAPGVLNAPQLPPWVEGPDPRTGQQSWRPVKLMEREKWGAQDPLRGTCMARLPSGAVCWSTVTFYLKWLLCCVRLDFLFYFEVRVPAVGYFGVSWSVSAVVESWCVPPVSCRPDYFSPAPRPSSLPNCPFPLWASVPAFRGLWIKETADWNSTLCLARLPFCARVHLSCPLHLQNQDLRLKQT